MGWGVKFNLETLRNRRGEVTRKVECALSCRKGSDCKGQTENSDVRLSGETGQYLPRNILVTVNGVIVVKLSSRG